MTHGVGVRDGEATMPDPSIAGWEIFSELLWSAMNNPKEFEKKVAFKQALAEAHKLNAGVMRLRSARYDKQVEARREEWIALVQALAATCRMQTGAKPPAGGKKPKH